MYYLRDLTIYNKDVFEERPPLMNKISLSPFFSFNQSEVTKFRAELALLVKELTILYSTRNVVTLVTQPNEEDAVALEMVAKEREAESLSQPQHNEQVNVTKTADAATTEKPTTQVEPLSEQEMPARVPEPINSSECNAVTQEKPLSESKMISICPQANSIVNAMRESFYKIYGEHYETVKEYGTSVMTRASYDEKVNLLVDSERYKGRMKPSDMQNAINRFVLIGKVKGSQLYR